MVLITKKPMTMGMEVPRARTRRNSEVLPGKRMWDIEEKRNAERPKPDITMATAVARYKTAWSESKKKARVHGEIPICQGNSSLWD